MNRYGVIPYVQLGEQTGGFSLIYNGRGERTLDILGVAEPITHVPAVCAEAAAIIVGPFLQVTSPALIEQIHAASDAPLFLDPQGLLRRIGAGGRIEHYCPAELAQIASLFHVIKANELEAQVITGVDPRENGAKALQRLKALGCDIAIITLAEAGSLISDGERHFVIPAYETEARDPTGAGDTYMAGFLHAYLRDRTDLQVAGCFGAAAASIWIEHTGPDAPITLEEVERRATTLLALS
jgi:sugar/nucleoside kinase (ribokinase family)